MSEPPPKAGDIVWFERHPKWFRNHGTVIWAEGNEVRVDVRRVIDIDSRTAEELLRAWGMSDPERLLFREDNRPNCRWNVHCLDFASVFLRCAWGKKPDPLHPWGT